MIIINADDFGRSQRETDPAVSCFRQGRITSASAMVFMTDSERAAECAQDARIDVGLHVNLSQPFTMQVKAKCLQQYHDRVVRFLTRNRYSLLFYHPALRRQFRYVYEAQVDEFVRLYGRRPTHVDGHRHNHLCANMLLDGIIPTHERVRRNFSFSPDEKGVVNRSYRRFIDRSLARRYKVTDFFFSLQQCLQHDRLTRVFELAKLGVVELMTHPANHEEYAYLMSDAYRLALDRLETGTYSSL